MSIPFTKVEAIGNNFVLIDALKLPEMDWPRLAVRMCAHRSGIGSDGLLVLLPSEQADFRMRMFNSDGSEDSCGNGLRCMAAYIHSSGLSRDREMVIEARDGLRQVEIAHAEDGSLSARVNMGRPSLRPTDIPAVLDMDEVTDYPLDVGGQVHRLTAVQVGSPHAVICAPLDSFWSEIPRSSALIETHEIFPERVNVTWCFPESPGSLKIRTWERGVGPTLGCGTGACAALVAASLYGIAGLSARVTSPGGSLFIEWPDREDIFMSGPACIVYKGAFNG